MSLLTLLRQQGAPPPTPVKVWLKVAGVWKECTVHIKVSSVWKVATPKTKVSGVWQ
jgi:hypothetical protein